jgi:hypothetical protein
MAKNKLLAALVVAGLTVLSVAPAQAMERDSISVAADALVARPVSFVATILGSAVFVVALPVAATSKSIDSTAEFLVRKPARFTFTRPLGDFSYDEYAYQPDASKQRMARATKATGKTAKK